MRATNFINSTVSLQNVKIISSKINGRPKLCLWSTKFIFHKIKILTNLRNLEPTKICAIIPVGVLLVGVSITLVKVVEPDAISICLTLLWNLCIEPLSTLRKHWAVLSQDWQLFIFSKTFFFFTIELHPRRLEMNKRESLPCWSPFSSHVSTCQWAGRIYCACARGGVS